MSQPHRGLSHVVTLCVVAVVGVACSACGGGGPPAASPPTTGAFGQVTSAETPTTTKSGAIAPPATPIGTATYQDRDGDTVTLTLTSTPPVLGNQVPADVGRACTGGDMQLDRSYFQEVQGTVTVTSSLDWRMTIPFLGTQSPTTQTETTLNNNVVEMLPTGPTCSLGVNTGRAFSFAGQPHVAYRFAVWMVFPNAVTPDQPTGDPAILGRSWYWPPINGYTPLSATGPGVSSCGFAPSGQADTCNT